jgi:hypothetical protein
MNGSRVGPPAAGARSGATRSSSAATRTGLRPTPSPATVTDASFLRPAINQRPYSSNFPTTGFEDTEWHQRAKEEARLWYEGVKQKQKEAQRTYVLPDPPKLIDPWPTMYGDETDRRDGIILAEGKWRQYLLQGFTSAKSAIRAKELKEFEHQLKVSNMSFLPINSLEQEERRKIAASEAAWRMSAEKELQALNEAHRRYCRQHDSRPTSSQLCAALEDAELTDRSILLAAESQWRRKCRLDFDATKPIICTRVQMDAERKKRQKLQSSEVQRVVSSEQYIRGQFLTSEEEFRHQIYQAAYIGRSLLVAAEQRNKVTRQAAIARHGVNGVKTLEAAEHQERLRVEYAETSWRAEWRKEFEVGEQRCVEVQQARTRQQDEHSFVAYRTKLIACEELETKFREEIRQIRRRWMAGVRDLHRGALEGFEETRRRRLSSQAERWKNIVSTLEEDEASQREGIMASFQKWLNLFRMNFDRDLSDLQHFAASRPNQDRLPPREVSTSGRPVTPGSYAWKPPVVLPPTPVEVARMNQAKLNRIEEDEAHERQTLILSEEKWRSKMKTQTTQAKEMDALLHPAVAILIQELTEKEATNRQGIVEAEVGWRNHVFTAIKAQRARLQLQNGQPPSK